jgi:hypothetical protein
LNFRSDEFPPADLTNRGFDPEALVGLLIVRMSGLAVVLGVHYSALLR